MAWRDGFVIEYVSSAELPPDGRLTCRKCAYFDKDRSCVKAKCFLPEMGYDSWKHCKWFTLTSEHDNMRNQEALARWKQNSAVGKRAELPTSEDLLRHKIYIHQGRKICRVLACTARGLRFRSGEKIMASSLSVLNKSGAYYCDAEGNHTTSTLKNLPAICYKKKR